MCKVYIALGGNIGKTKEIFLQVLKRLSQLANPKKSLRCSQFFRTKPVSPIEQDDFLNAVACLKTELNLQEFWLSLQEIEKDLGKVPKSKESPRVIDLDILFFGDQEIEEGDLQIPHPRWKERLFVLLPLAELTATSPVGGENIKQLIHEVSWKISQ